jgi:hypothetical protein
VSFLRNPSFEKSFGGVGTDWFRNNLAESITCDESQSNSMARSGDRVCMLRTTQPGGSIAQDFTAYKANTEPVIRSVSAFGWFRAANYPDLISGSLTLWDMSAVPDRPVSSRFEVGPSWMLITTVIDRVGSPPSNTNWRVRAEVYVNTINASLLIDSVNTF